MLSFGSLAINTVVRSAFGAGFVRGSVVGSAGMQLTSVLQPMFAYQMCKLFTLRLRLAHVSDCTITDDTLTVPGASSLLGGLLIVFAPAPFILYKYGKKIRSWSKNA